MKHKTVKAEVNESELTSTVPASSHFIETCSKSKSRNLGEWLKVLDDDSLSYITSLFNPIHKNIPDGMALPVCDIVSLCLLIEEWESGKKFYAKDAWDNSLPMLPRLRRALILESIRRNGLIEILKISILDDDFEIKINPTEHLDDLLSKWLEVELDKNKLFSGVKSEEENEFFTD